MLSCGWKVEKRNIALEWVKKLKRKKKKPFQRIFDVIASLLLNNKFEILPHFFPMFLFIPPEEIRKTCSKREHYEEMGWEIKK